MLFINQDYLTISVGKFICMPMSDAAYAAIDCALDQDLPILEGLGEPLGCCTSSPEVAVSSL
jgi:hypothetical protein